MKDFLGIQFAMLCLLIGCDHPAAGIESDHFPQSVFPILFSHVEPERNIVKIRIQAEEFAPGQSGKTTRVYSVLGATTSHETKIGEVRYDYYIQKNYVFVDSENQFLLRSEVSWHEDEDYRVTGLFRNSEGEIEGSVESELEALDLMDKEGNFIARRTEPESYRARALPTRYLFQSASTEDLLLIELHHQSEGQAQAANLVIYRPDLVDFKIAVLFAVDRLAYLEFLLNSR